jgi:pyridinium-3,5-biscarboxylic acid mononucleotide sulfurtransferase
MDAFEDGLRALGFGQVRVRFHDTIARLELDVADLARACEPGARQRIVALGKELGFTYVAVDLAGFRSGSLNETLDSTGQSELVPLRVKAAPRTSG